MNFFHFLCRERVERTRQAERERFRRLMGQVMARHESPDVLLAMGQLLELVDEEEPHDSRNGRAHTDA